MKPFCVQEAVRRRRVRIIKIRGTANPTDIQTKPKSIDDTWDRLPGVGVPIDYEKWLDASIAPNSCAQLPGQPHPSGQFVGGVLV